MHKIRAATISRNIDWTSKRYLIIEDMEQVRQMLQKLLQGLGAKLIEHATNGGEAIGHLSHYRYDVVLCDYNLGEAKNGQQVLEEARERVLVPPSCVWMMVTADKSAETVMGSAEHQPDGYLLKPISEAGLYSRLTRAVQRRSVFHQIDETYLAKDYLRAAAMCDAQLQATPAYSLDLMRMKGTLLVKAGELDKARVVYEAVLAERETSWAMSGLAAIRLQAGEAQAARLLFERVIEANRYYLDAYDQLSVAYQKLGMNDAACEVLEKAVQLSPNSVTRQQNIGDIALKMGNLPMAEKAYRKCIAIGEYSVRKTSAPYFGLARVCGQQENTVEAMQLLATAQRDFPDEPLKLRAKYAETLVLHESGDYVRAHRSGQDLAALLEAEKEYPDTATCLDIANLLVSVGVRDGAARVLVYLVRNHDDDTQILKEAQKVFDKARMEEGEELIMDARKYAADMMNQGLLLWKADRLDEAVAWTRTARSALPNNLRVLFNSAQVIITHLRQVGYDAELAGEARQVLMRIDKVTPNHPRFAQLIEELEELKSWAGPV
ncbi:MAG: response regulator [Pseudomonadota bacterium]